MATKSPVPPTKGVVADLDDRLTGGSMAPRLNPEVVFPGLNQKLGPKRPDPLVRATSQGAGAVPERMARQRLRYTMLPKKFIGD